MVFIVGILACHKDHVSENLELEIPPHFPDIQYNLKDNAITNDKFNLGKKLFYDPILSADNTISCGSCHIQTSAFTHHGHSLSHGIYDRIGKRNSPPIMNLAWNNSFMWDGGIFNLDLLSISPITNHAEMDETLPHILQKLKSYPNYPSLFKNAFGQDSITGTLFLKALAQFMLMCTSTHSKYDSFILKKTELSPLELQGYQVFKNHCNVCHREPLFTNHEYLNNGLSISSFNDLGRGLITSNVNDNYTFKVPSLRNLSYTAPYMHDGRYLNLEAVFDHYS